MSSSALDWRPICKGWLKTLPASQNDTLWGLFDDVFQVSVGAGAGNPMCGFVMFYNFIDTNILYKFS